MEHRRERRTDWEQKGAATQLGNLNERLELNSGVGLVIDQFMLGNSQLVSQLAGLPPVDRHGSNEELKAAVEKFGGALFNLNQGTYRALRFPEKSTILLSAGDSESKEDAGNNNGESESFERPKEASTVLGTIYVDTRCMVFVDATLLADRELMEEYGKLRRNYQEKEARDFIRSKGGAVRYGFNKFGDRLELHAFPGDNKVALWPVVD